MKDDREKLKQPSLSEGPSVSPDGGLPNRPPVMNYHVFAERDLPLHSIPEERPPVRRVVFWFVVGFVGGTVASWTIWNILFNVRDLNGYVGHAMFAVPLLKVAVAGAVAGLRRFPGAPAGIITSIGIGGLFFFGGTLSLWSQGR